MIYKLSNKKLREWRNSQYKYFDFKNKYISFILNRVNATYVKANLPNIVGSCKNLIREYYQIAGKRRSYDDYVKFYSSRQPTGIKDATDKLYKRFHEDKELMAVINPKLFTRKVIHNWVYELVLPNTYYGFMFQDLIIEDIGKRYNKTFKFATPEEESKGIDGWIGNTPIQVKPNTAKGQNFVTPIGGFVVYYEKDGKGINYEIGEDLEKVLTGKMKIIIKGN